MRFASRLIAWSRGWVEFSRRGNIPGYAERCVLARLRLDARALVRATLTKGFAGAALACVATGLAAQVLAWEWDLVGWRRDGLLCLPVLLVAPWVAGARRRHVEALLAATAASSAVDENAVTERPPPSGHSARSGTAERWRWRKLLPTWRWRIPGRGSAGSISSWSSLASASWRRWRSRASAE